MDSKLNINLPLKKLFNNLRIANNSEWPSFFIYKNKKSILLKFLARIKYKNVFISI